MIIIIFIIIRTPRYCVFCRVNAYPGHFIHAQICFNPTYKNLFRFSGETGFLKFTAEISEERPTNCSIPTSYVLETR